MNKEAERKNILVTGGSRGIGAACCQILAKNGCHVLLQYHQNEQAAIQTLETLEGNGHKIIQADMSDPASIESLYQKCQDMAGKIDVLVNNAGIYETMKLPESNYEAWQENWAKTIATNLQGPANLSFLIAGEMIQRNNGRIVNITSRGAFRGEPEAMSYGAAKAGLNSLGQSMAKALAGYGILVFTIAPGFVETDMAKDFLNGPDGENIKSQSPFHRAATPDEIANIVAYCALEAPEYMSGTIIDANGASYLRS